MTASERRKKAQQKTATIKRRLLRELDVAKKELQTWTNKFNYWYARAGKMSVSDKRWKEYYQNKEIARLKMNEATMLVRELEEKT